MKYVLDRFFRWISSPLRKLPDFIIIGTQKGGTTSLFYYLQQHPDLAMSSVKEVQYYGVQHKKGQYWYRTHFPYIWNRKLTGEASPYYLFHPLVAQRIKKDNPKVKFIVMLRDPIERAYSHFNMQKRRESHKIKSFYDALKLEDQIINNENEKFFKNSKYVSLDHQMYSYLSRGKYAEQLERWFKHFDKDIFLFIKSEDFFTNPKQSLIQTFEFLNIKQHFPNDLTPQNAGKYEDIPAELRIELQNYFLSDMNKLKSMLGDKFSWF